MLSKIRFLTKLVGWLGKSRVTDREALLIEACQSIHTIGMQIVIDVLFLDSRDRVIHMIHNMRPNRISKAVVGSAKVVELKGGMIAKSKIELQDIIILVDGMSHYE